MGIQNKDGALYFATGIDNSGLYSGRREAIGIIKAMASEITAFDVFGGIGISAGIAFARAAKGAYDFEKQFQQSMKEVATLSNGIKGSLTDYMNQVMEITRVVPVEANEAAKALYQIVSAGHDGVNGMKVLEASAKAAVGGVTDTATAADAITTVLNAYKLDASKAQEVSDQLFTTVRLGKTDFGQLGKSIAQAAPIAASFGIDIKEVLGAVASITKQGVPTSEAMTKIRAAILGTANQLGDAAFKGRTFQEALQLIYDKAGGSSTKMKELLGTDEALQAALMLTGEKAKEAASDLDEVNNSAGAAEAAFKEMASSAENQMKLLGNNITATLRPLGKEILKEVSSIATSFNKAFENGDAQESLRILGTLIVTLTSAFIGYKGSIIAINAVKKIHISLLEMEKYEMTLYQKAVEAGTVSENVLTAAQVKQMATRKAMITTIKMHTASLLKNTAAMLANPYILAAAAAATLGYAIYKYATRATAAEKSQYRFNKTVKESQQRAEDYKNKIQGLVSIARSDAAATTERYKALLQLQRLMKSVFKDMDLKKLKDMDDLELTNKIAEAEARRNVVIAKTNLVMAKQRLQKIDNQIILTNNRNGYTGALKEDREAVAKEVDLLQGEVDRAVKVHSISIKAHVQSQKEAATQNKAFWTKQKDDATKALDSIASAQKKLMDVGNFKGIDATVITAYKENIKKLKEAEKELKVYDSFSKQDDKAQKLREEQEKYKLLLEKQKFEQGRIKEDSANELEQIEINKLKESSEKVLRQRALNHRLELQAIKRETEDKKRKVIEDARAAFEINPQNKKKVFNADVFINSESTKKLFASFDNIAKEATIATNTKFDRGDDLSDLLNQYQDYTDQRLAIERKFNEDIATLQEQRKQAVKNGDTDQVEQIDRSIAQATKNKGMELMGLDYDKLKESPEYVRAFENLKETSSETLNSLLTQLENAKSTAAKVLSPDQLREYTSTIQSIMDELDSRNPFQLLSDKKKELAEAEEELANAQIELENARIKAEAVKGGAKFENGIKSSKYNPETGKIESTKAYLSEAQVLEQVKKKTENYNAAKDKVVKKDNQVKKAEKEVRAQISELADTIDELGKKISGPAGEIISLIGNIGAFTMTAMSGVESAANTSANAISTVEKASVILAIISAAMQVAMKIFDLFGKDDTTEKYEKAKEAYESYINILDRVIEKQLELAETLTGDNANAAYDKALEMIRLQNENARVLGKQYLNSGASGKSHSKGYTEVEDMSMEGWKQAADTLGMSVDEFKDKMGGRMAGLFDLTDEQLAKLQENAGIFWSQLDSDTQKFADQIVDGVTQVAEVVEQKITDATLIDIDGLRSDFQDLLTDMDADSADFADNFEEYMRNAILNSMLKEDYMSRLTAWREKFYKAMDDGVTEEEYNALKAEGQQISDDMKAKRDALAEMYGWNKDDDEREASKKGFASMSQDSADKLDGAFAVMTSHTYSINEGVKQIQLSTDKIIEKLVYLSNMDKNIGEMVKHSDLVITYLSDISSHTARLEAIEKAIESIRMGIDTLNTKGITLKR
ncbi:phage tail tape measure protein [Bacteroides thetaiotaomicron]|uniref:phage tail tape measure protein n=1 Tax=Bacteroides thetaiotaomicron TaxID=818 RepID=UPI0039C200BA